MNYLDLLDNIMVNGDIYSPHGREVKEVMHTYLYVEPGQNIFSWPVARPIEKIKTYLMKELAWYMSGDRNCSFIAKHANLWEKIKNPDGTINSNYGNLLFYNRTPHPSLKDVTLTPFMWALYCLSADKDSRQATMTYNTGGFSFPNNGDFICTQHQSFFIRNETLMCFIALRSSDVIFGLPYNMVWWSIVQQQLFKFLKKKYKDLQIGRIEVDIYSAHIYKHHYELVERMLQEMPALYNAELVKEIPIGRGSVEWYDEHINEYVKVEAANEKDE